MTNREVYMEVEKIISPFYPEYDDSEELRLEINRAVGVVEFELGIPKMMAVSYVKNVFSSYSVKLD